LHLVIGFGAHGVHDAKLEVHEHGARDVPSPAGLVVVDVDALELEVGVASVLARVVDPVLVADHLPELTPIWLPHCPPWMCRISLMEFTVLDLRQPA